MYEFRALLPGQRHFALQNPGESDWFAIIVGTSLFLITPMVISLLLGITLRNLATRIHHGPHVTRNPPS